MLLILFYVSTIDKSKGSADLLGGYRSQPHSGIKLSKPVHKEFNISHTSELFVDNLRAEDIRMLNNKIPRIGIRGI